MTQEPSTVPAETIERVAEAIYLTRFEDHFELDPFWELPEDAKELWRGEARAALEALGLEQVGWVRPCQLPEPPWVLSNEPYGELGWEPVYRLRDSRTPEVTT